MTDLAVVFNRRVVKAVNLVIFKCALVKDRLDGPPGGSAEIERKYSFTYMFFLSLFYEAIRLLRSTPYSRGVFR